MMECVVTNLVDEYPKYLRPRKELFIFLVCFVAFLFGFTIITQVCCLNKITLERVEKLHLRAGYRIDIGLGLRSLSQGVPPWLTT